MIVSSTNFFLKKPVFVEVDGEVLGFLNTSIAYKSKPDGSQTESRYEIKINDKVYFLVFHSIWRGIILHLVMIFNYIPQG